MACPKPVLGAEVNQASPTWRPTGNADAIFYLGEASTGICFDRGLRVEKVLIPSQEAQALRYLRPCSQEWYTRNPGKAGVTTDFRLRGFNDWLPEALQVASKEQGRPINHALCAESPLALDGKTLDLLHRLVLVEAEAGIWAGYLEESK